VKLIPRRHVLQKTHTNSIRVAANTFVKLLEGMKTPEFGGLEHKRIPSQKVTTMDVLL